MKKGILYSILFLGCIYTTNAQSLLFSPTEIRNNPEALAINNIVSCQTYVNGKAGKVEKFDKHGNTTYQKDYAEYRYFIVYDTSKHISQQHTFKNNIYTKTLSAEYNKTGQVLKTTNAEKSPTGMQIREHFYAYASNRKIKEIIHSGKPNTREIFTYSGDELKQTVEINEQNDTLRLCSYKNGHPIYIRDNNSVCLIVYNKEGLMLSKTMRTFKENLIYSYSISYKNGLIDQYTYTNKDGKIINMEKDYEVRIPNTQINGSLPRGSIPSVTLINQTNNSNAMTVATDHEGNFFINTYIPATDLYALRFNTGRQITIILHPKDNIDFNITKDFVNIAGSTDNTILFEMINRFNLLTAKDDPNFRTIFSDYLLEKVKEHPDFLGHLYFSNYFVLSNPLYQRYADIMLKLYPNNLRARELNENLKKAKRVD